MLFPSKSYPTCSESLPAHHEFPPNSPPKSPPESPLAFAKEPLDKDNPDHLIMDPLLPPPHSMKSDDFDMDAFMLDDEEDPTKVQQRQVSNIVKLLDDDLLTASQRADLYVTIQVSLNPPMSVAVSLPCKKKTGRGRDCNSPLKLLVTDHRFIRTPLLEDGVYHGPPDLQPSVSRGKEQLQGS